mmetsp:Transcript_8393/g.20747  ORF Transcript_8393/g.20747 Transcript_8393/m.20747 type:complete len:162 (+) Transcript_8393:790-1275(+)
MDSTCRCVPLIATQVKRFNGTPCRGPVMPLAGRTSEEVCWVPLILLKLQRDPFVAQSLTSTKKLGLGSKPNTGDNGVHASASPFEALAERNNWLGKSVEDDAYGKGLLAAGVPLEVIAKWSGDCQVSVQGETKEGKTMSVFDTLEDLDADSVLSKVSKISK